MAVTLTIHLSDDEFDMLRVHAQRHGCGPEDAVRRVITEFPGRGAADGLTPGLFDSGDPTFARRVDLDPGSSRDQLKARAAALGMLVTRVPEDAEQPSRPVDLDRITRLTAGWGPQVDAIIADRLTKAAADAGFTVISPRDEA